MTYLERKELELLSRQVFGSATRYAKLLKGHYVEGKKTYPGLEEIKQYMTELLVLQEQNIKNFAAQYTNSKEEQNQLLANLNLVTDVPGGK